MSECKCSGLKWSQSIGQVAPLETSSDEHKVLQLSTLQGKSSNEAIGVQVVGVAADEYCQVVD